MDTLFSRPRAVKRSGNYNVDDDYEYCFGALETPLKSYACQVTECFACINKSRRDLRRPRGGTINYLAVRTRLVAGYGVHAESFIQVPGCETTGRYIGLGIKAPLSIQISHTIFLAPFDRLNGKPSTRSYFYKGVRHLLQFRTMLLLLPMS